MSNKSVTGVLEELGAGDLADANQTLRAYEVLLRRLVRRQLNARLRTKVDSGDIVQTVWLDILRRLRSADRSFANTEHLKAFLVKAVRHRFVDQSRHLHAALEREEPAGGLALEGVPAADPRPSEIARAKELWTRMLAECPPAHRELLRLKRQGYSIRELALHTGLHEDSIRRILRQLASQMVVHS